MTARVADILAGDILLRRACTMCISGPSRCGKTSFVYKILTNLGSMYSDGEKPEQILYCYAMDQPLYSKMESNVPNIEFFKGLPTHEKIDSLTNGNHNLIILDDLMMQLLKSEDIVNMFILGSHHRNLSVFFMSQNVFQSGRHGRTIALNTQYLTLFQNPRDKSQIKYLVRQIFPDHSHYVCEAFYDAAVAKDFGYLFIDLTQQCKEDLRVRACITPEEVTVVYQALKN